MVYFVVGIEKTSAQDKEVAEKVKAVVSGNGELLPMTLENQKYYNKLKYKIYRWECR